MGRPYELVSREESQGNAMKMWKAAKADREARLKVMRCAHCGGSAYAGESCNGCGSRQFLWTDPNEGKISQ